MSKIAVVYWSGTGNTEMMAEEIVAKIQELGSEANMIFANDFSADNIGDFDGFAFGCPAMGSEQLEEDSFEPMFESVEGSLGSKPVVIFGSYEWADGQWMLDWTDRCKASGINLVADGLAVYDTPDDEGKKACQDLAQVLVDSL